MTAEGLAKCSFFAVFRSAGRFLTIKSPFASGFSSTPIFPVIDPADALEALLDELKRQRAAGVTKVSVSPESLEFLRRSGGAAAPSSLGAPARSGEATGSRATSPIAAFRAAAQAAQPPKPTRPTPVVAAAAPASPIPDPPVFTLPAGDKVARLAALHALIAQCPETRRHLSSGQRPVLGQGSVDARLFFVGEAPTLEEAEAGRPFVGASGDLLRKILAAGLIGEELTYLAPVMGWRPEPPTAHGKRPPNARELAFNLPYLRAQIEIVRPQVIVALGAQACEALHPGSPPITQARGRWLDFQGIPLLPTFHPNYLLHTPSPSAKRTVWEDFLAVMERAGLPISDKQRGYFLPA